MALGFQPRIVGFSLHSPLAGTALAASCWAIAVPHGVQAQNTIVVGAQDDGSGTGTTVVCATADDNVVVRAPDGSATLDCGAVRAIVVGEARVGGSHAIAIGTGASAGGNATTGTSSANIAIGLNASANPVPSNGVGKAIAIGEFSRANGLESTAVGANAFASSQWASAYGYQSFADFSGTAVGRESNAGLSGTSVGSRSVSATAAVAVGDGASASGVNSVAIGGSFNPLLGSPGPTASGARAVSVGAGSNSTVSGAVALGSGSTADGLSSVAIGENSNTAGRANVVSFGNAVSTRTLINVSAGALAAVSTDAVNGSQLFATNQNVAANSAATSTVQAGLVANAVALGGGSSYNSSTGVFTAPTYNVSGATQNDVGAALAALDTSIANVASISGNSVQYDTDALGSRVNQVTLAGGDPAAPVGLRNVAAGSLTASSTDAVNGSQLFATNEGVAANTAGIALLGNRVSTNEANIAAIDSRLVAAEGAAATIGASVTDLDARLSATETLVADNSAAIVMLEDGLHSVNSGLADVAAALGGGASYDAATGSLTAPTYNVAGTTHNDVGMALAALDDSISGLTALADNAVSYDTDVAGNRLSSLLFPQYPILTRQSKRPLRRSAVTCWPEHIPKKRRPANRNAGAREIAKPPVIHARQRCR